MIKTVSKVGLEDNVFDLIMVSMKKIVINMIEWKNDYFPDLDGKKVEIFALLTPGLN